jgi:hypothetical protein
MSDRRLRTQSASAQAEQYGDDKDGHGDEHRHRKGQDGEQHEADRRSQLDSIPHEGQACSWYRLQDVSP